MPSHGSLSKAGKQRNLNTRTFREEKEKGTSKKRKFYHKQKHKVPRSSRRRRYNRWYNETYILPKLVKMGIVREVGRRKGKKW